MVAVPHQQPLALGVLPPEGGLVLVEGIHAVVAVDVGEEEFHPVFQHGVPVAHGDAVDVRDHGGVQVRALFGEEAVPIPELPAESLGVHQVGEVQIAGGQADLSLGRQAAEGVLFFRRGLLKEFFHAEEGLAVPAEAGGIGRGGEPQHGANVVHLVVDDPFLQVRVADVRVGVVDHVDGLNGVCHREASLVKSKDDFSAESFPGGQGEQAGLLRGHRPAPSGAVESGPAPRLP